MSHEGHKAHSARPEATWWDRLRAWWRPRETVASRHLRSREVYESFRAILAMNDRTLELIADLEESLDGQRPQPIEALAHRVREACNDVREMCRHLNIITGDRYERLVPVVQEITTHIEETLPLRRALTTPPYTLQLAQLRALHTPLCGNKMANLGEVGGQPFGARIPEGFVITQQAFSAFMSHNQLWPRADALAAIATDSDTGELARACAELERAIIGGRVPPAVAEAVMRAGVALAGRHEGLLAVRSSAVGEDTEVSHAGQYLTLLNVPVAGLLDAYRRVLASAFSLGAVTYRRQRGLPVAAAAMAVGCLEMVDARCSGVLLTRDYQHPERDRLVLSSVCGTSEGLTGGTSDAEELVLDPDRLDALHSGLLNDQKLGALVHAARALERHFQKPQDIEWAVDRNNELVFLQVRPMNFAPAPVLGPPVIAPGQVPVVQGGITACPGAAVGVVARLDSQAELDSVPAGAVLVAHAPRPIFCRVMRRVAALATEVGSPTGHTAILARELGLPCLVGVPHLLDVVRPGEVVTVDAFRGQIFRGAFPVPPRRALPEPTVDAAAQASLALRRACALVIPLSLVDPTSKDFAPRGCRTLHDVTRYVHEKIFAAMFHFADLAEHDPGNTVRLRVELPFTVLLYDVGDGIEPDRARTDDVGPEAIASTPLRAFLAGLLDARIRWRDPRPVSTSGFLSVLGAGIAGPPPEAQQLGRMTYAVISDRYLNFSAKAGYHFTTVDAYCGKSVNKNYIHYRFSGGGAGVGRRTRRVRFIERVLVALDFHVDSRGDTLTAQMRKREGVLITERLSALGRLTLVTRQLDMLMDTESSPDFFAEAFLDGRWDVF
jgi:pyruvate,water dikinase